MNHLSSVRALLYFAFPARLLITALFFFAICNLNAQQGAKKSSNAEKFPATNVDIRQELEIFHDKKPGDSFWLILCADVPDNRKPMRVARQQETGHVFIILQKINTVNDTTSRVFGFYPRKGLQTVFFRNTKSIIKDNSYREHDVQLSRELSSSEFDTVLAKAIEYSGKRYHMNRFNCYDYAIEIFNSVAGTHPLPLVYVRFPFIFGRGGSPCSVYKSFRELKDSGSYWKDAISFGELVAPISTDRLFKP
jgi:hypothetical protein